MYYKKIDAVFQELSTNKDGLHSLDAKARLERYGPNKLKEKEKI